MLLQNLILEGENVANIHRKLVNVDGKAALDVSTVRRWFSRVNGNPTEKGGNRIS